MLETYIKLLKDCQTFRSACKVYSYILKDAELTKEERQTLDVIYNEITAKMPYIMD